MSSSHSPSSGFSFGRRLTLRAAALAFLGLCSLFVLHRGKPLRADAPPAATLISPNGGTVAIGKPYFLWNSVSTATEYRLKVDNSSSVTVIDSWYLSTAVCSGSTCGVTAPSSLSNGSYTWWIQTKNNDGTGPLSSSMTFTVTAYGVVDGGFAHSVAANRDGGPSAWGLNFYGQIGDGSTLDRFTAVGITGLTGIVDIQAGEFHTVALRNDGRVYTIGYNGQGQLGIGLTTDSATAVEVSGITDAVAIAVGRNHTGPSRRGNGQSVRREWERTARRQLHDGPHEPGDGVGALGSRGHRYGGEPLSRGEERWNRGRVRGQLLRSIRRRHEHRPADSGCGQQPDGSDESGVERFGEPQLVSEVRRNG